MRRTNFKLMAGCIITVIGVFLVGCNDSDSFCDNIQMTCHTRSTVSSQVYLDISSYSFLYMTSEDFSKFYEAEQRMGVTHHGADSITFNGLSAKELNISDSLYLFVVKVVENTNQLNSHSNRQGSRTLAKRKVSGSSEQGGGSTSEAIPDCVIKAIRHVSGNTKTYAQIKNYCDTIFPNWETSGGIPTIQIQGIMKKCCGIDYTPVTGEAFRTKYSALSDTLFFANKEVAAFVRTGTGCKANEDHCVNICSLMPSSNTPQFYVYDFQQVKEYKKSIDDLICIFLKP